MPVSLGHRRAAANGGFRRARAREGPAIASAPPIAVRRAGTGDAEALAALSAETFAETFGHLYPLEDLAFYLAEAHNAALYAGWARDDRFALWIVEQGGRAVGYALAGPCHLPHPEVTAACGELWRLYLRREAQGSGLGGRLLTLALDWLRAPGRRLWIGVWSENFGAQRLYARYGFAKVGAYEFSVGGTRDLEFILARPG
ncbi:MAG TPA: GNAT family N-acetyltransferase [Caulobacteraceae bacterium]|jgi:ribosomal protein S18 acetylase RimI-like enzyme|nr:GNAT family N-acetyltransferase [Caulobacteraceae bacterium]